MTEQSKQTERGRRALGRGLDSLLPPAAQGSTEVALNAIDANPSQPRQRFDRAALEDLAASIAEYGVVQPLVVTARPGGRYQIIVGERRWQAARLAGLSTIPVVVREASDQETLELALIENVQRADLNPLEEAAAYQRLMKDFGLTQEDVSRRVGRSRAAVANTVRLLTLPELLKRAVIEQRISEGHARALLQVPDSDGQIALLERVEHDGLNVRQTEELTRRAIAVPRERRESIDRSEVEAVEGDLRRALGTKVHVRPSARGGRIVIEYYSNEEFDGLYRRLLNPS